MLVVAVTGGIGSGKSTVIDLFRAKGIPVIDTDIIAREVVQEPAVLTQLGKTFGHEILNSDSSLNRNALRQMAFASDDNRSKLNNILHPLIHQRAVAQLANTDAEYCLLVIPLLFESRYPYQYDRVLVIDATPEKQIERSMQRDNATRAGIQNIIAAQATREQRLSIADDVIDNNGELAGLKPQVETLHKKYLEISRNF